MLIERCVSVRIRGAEVMVRTAAGFGILCSTSPVIAKGRRGISLMARAGGPGRREGGEIVKGTFSDL